VPFSFGEILWFLQVCLIPKQMLWKFYKSMGVLFDPQWKKHSGCLKPLITMKKKIELKFILCPIQSLC
jgi:hypothetical protein